MRAATEASGRLRRWRLYKAYKVYRPAGFKRAGFLLVFISNIDCTKMEKNDTIPPKDVLRGMTYEEGISRCGKAAAAVFR